MVSETSSLTITLLKVPKTQYVSVCEADSTHQNVWINLQNSVQSLVVRSSTFQQDLKLEYKQHKKKKRNLEMSKYLTPYQQSLLKYLYHVSKN